MLLQPRSKIVFIGDSITDCGRAHPVGEGLFEALGKGYVSLVDALLTATYPAHYLRVVNMGTSGHQVPDLAARWNRDVIALKPDYLSILIGINDVWRQFDLPRIPEQHVPLEAYATGLETLITRTRTALPALKGLILCTPFHIENLPQDAMRHRMTQYADVVRSLAGKHNTILVDTQAAFDEVLGVGKPTPTLHSCSLAWDRIHPGMPGHMIIARAWLKAVGFAW